MKKYLVFTQKRVNIFTERCRTVIVLHCHIASHVLDNSIFSERNESNVNCHFELGTNITCDPDLVRNK